MVEPLEARALLCTLVVSSTGDSGPGTLRAAIEQANRGPARDKITFTRSVTGTITLARALPDLSTSIFIAGPGAQALTLARSRADGVSAFRIFTVSTGALATISGLTLKGGSDSEGGGILNSGSLTLIDTVISGNSATGSPGMVFPGLPMPGGPYFAIDPGGDGNGGGVYNAGSLSLINATISENSAVGGSVRGHGNGGGVYSTGPLLVVNTMISGNSAVGGTYFTSRLPVGGPGTGGGIYNAGKALVVNSTIRANAANGGSPDGRGDGGGAYNAGSLSLVNTTMSDNVATGYPGAGGGIAIGSTPNTLVVSLNSIFANVQGGNLTGGADGSFRSLGHNLFSDAPRVALDSTDKVNTNPLLAPPANSGGPTLTQALLPGSPAIDAGALVAGVTADQRGLPRPAGAAPDIGAFEVQDSVPPTVITVQWQGGQFQPTTLLVGFSQSMNAARANNLTNYQLVGTGPDHRFGTHDDLVIRFRSVSYEPASHTVTLRPVCRLRPGDAYRLLVRGKPTAGLTNNSGLFLAGAGAGKAGTNYWMTLDSRLLVPPILKPAGKRDAVAHGQRNG